MKKLSFFLLLILLSFSNIGLSQDEPNLLSIVKSKEKFKVSIFKKHKIYLKLEAKDTILLTFSELNGRLLSEINIIAPNGVITKIKGISELQNYYYPALEDGNYRFEFKQRIKLNFESLARRRCDVLIEKQFEVPPAKEPKTFIYYDTITRVDKIIELTKTDTTITQLPDTEIRISARRNIYGNTRKIIPMEVPENTNFIIYWIGVGNAVKAKYTKIGSKFEDAENIANPLDAYFKNKVTKLPQSTIGNNFNIQFAASNGDRSNFIKGENINLAEKETYGYLYYNDIKDSVNLYLCLENKELVSGVPVFLSAMAVNITETWDTISKDTMIIRRSPSKVELKSTLYEDAVKELEKMQEDLDYAKMSFNEDIIAKRNALDSIEQLGNAEFDTVQVRIDEKWKDLEAIRYLVQEEGLSPTEAQAIVRADKLEKQLEQAQKDADDLEESLKALKDIKAPSKDDFELPKVEIPKVEKKGIIGFFQKLFGIK